MKLKIVELAQTQICHELIAIFVSKLYIHTYIQVTQLFLPKKKKQHNFRENAINLSITLILPHKNNYNKKHYNMT